MLSRCIEGQDVIVHISPFRFCRVETPLARVSRPEGIMKRKQAFDSSPELLRIWKISGEEMAAIPVEELSDVRSLKQQLQMTHGLPSRFRLKLLHASLELDDDLELDSPIDVNLVVLPLVAFDPEKADELVQAVSEGKADHVELVLNRPQDPDAASSQGETPLCQAAKGGFADCALLLLEARADTDMRGREGTTPLRAACRQGHEDVARLLLEAEASVEDGDLSLLGWA